MIKEILEGSFTSDHTVNFGLYSGFPGIMLTTIEYYKWKQLEPDKQLNEAIQQIIDSTVHYPDITFAGGKSGINWFYAYLRRLELIDEEDYNAITYDTPMLQQASLHELLKGNWDFLHGAIGIAYYSLYHYQDTYEQYFRDFFQELQSICQQNKISGLFPNYHFNEDRFVPEEINMGLAHGIPSVLKFCVQCYKQNICSEEAKSMAWKLIDYLMTHTNTDTAKGYFPYVVRHGEQPNTPTRLAWCYGDPGAGIILYQAGIAFEDKKVIDFALEILRYSATRRSAEEALIRDAGICHGSAGVAHIFHKMWHYTKETIFKEAADFWIEKTLAFGAYADGIAGYKKYIPTDKTLTAEPGLLEGTAGIALVLFSYITGNFDWDYCLMLND